jgi:hypothetical protein
MVGKFCFFFGRKVLEKFDSLNQNFVALNCSLCHSLQRCSEGFARKTPKCAFPETFHRCSPKRTIKKGKLSKGISFSIDYFFAISFDSFELNLNLSFFNDKKHCSDVILLEQVRVRFYQWGLILVFSSILTVVNSEFIDKLLSFRG